MSAVTLAVLRDARAAALKQDTPEALAYIDTIDKAPAIVAAAHLLGVAWRYAVHAARIVAGRAE